MKINLIWVGKTKEPFIIEGLKKYLKLAGKYSEVNITEIKDEKGADIRNVLAKEGERIARLKLPYILLDEKGREFSSVEFAEFMEGQSQPLNFLMGGAFGVSDEVRNNARCALALSRMTLTHEMARLFFLEQLYRSFTISRKQGYHH